jgi:hypothetical protein
MLSAVLGQQVSVMGIARDYQVATAAAGNALVNVVEANGYGWELHAKPDLVAELSAAIGKAVVDAVDAARDADKGLD